MKVSERKIDPKKREDGAWVDNIPEWDGLKLKVRGVGNKDWARLENKLINAVPRKRRMNGIEPEDRDRINGILLRDCALIDWKGIEDDAGQPEPYSKEQANTYLTKPEFEPFRGAVLWAAMVVAEQGKDEVEADVKN